MSKPEPSKLSPFLGSIRLNAVTRKTRTSPKNNYIGSSRWYNAPLTFHVPSGEFPPAAGISSLGSSGNYAGEPYIVLPMVVWQPCLRPNKKSDLVQHLLEQHDLSMSCATSVVEPLVLTAAMHDRYLFPCLL